MTESGLLFFCAWLAVYIPALLSVLKTEEPDKMEKCSFCNSPMTLVHDFGPMALAGSFLKQEQFAKEERYPLRLCYCSACYSLQLADKVSPDVMFRNYFYFSSATDSIRKHFREYAEEVVERFTPTTAIEIGCNDGVLTGPLQEAGVKVTGVDPSNTIPEGPNMIRDYFTEPVASRIGEVDLIIANNVFAHVEDIRALTKAVTLSMGPKGVFIIEAHYLGDMLDNLQYDWIYHEHIYYYSLLSLEAHFERFGLSVFDVRPVRTHGGSMRYYISRAGIYGETKAVKDLRAREKRNGLDRLSTFMDFSDRIREHRKALRKTVNGLKGKVAGYGASGRANTIIQYCGIDVDYIVDDAPAKHGYYTPGSHIPIVPRGTLETDPPDHMIAFAWGYANEIMGKCNLPMIVPLPQIEILETKDAA